VPLVEAVDARQGRRSRSTDEDEDEGERMDGNRTGDLAGPEDAFSSGDESPESPRPAGPDSASRSAGGSAGTGSASGVTTPAGPQLRRISALSDPASQGSSSGGRRTSTQASETSTSSGSRRSSRYCGLKEWWKDGLSLATLVVTLLVPVCGFIAGYTADVCDMNNAVAGIVWASLSGVAAILSLCMWLWMLVRVASERRASYLLRRRAANGAGTSSAGSARTSAGSSLSVGSSAVSTNEGPSGPSSSSTPGAHTPGGTPNAPSTASPASSRSGDRAGRADSVSVGGTRIRKEGLQETGSTPTSAAGADSGAHGSTTTSTTSTTEKSGSASPAGTQVEKTRANSADAYSDSVSTADVCSGHTVSTPSLVTVSADADGVGEKDAEDPSSGSALFSVSESGANAPENHIVENPASNADPTPDEPAASQALKFPNASALQEIASQAFPFRFSCFVAVFMSSLWAGLFLLHREFGDYKAFEAELDKNWGYLLVLNEAPVWLGEFGVADSDGDLWWTYIMRYIQERNLDFSYWAVDGQQDVGVDEPFGLMNSDYNSLRYLTKSLDLFPGLNYTTDADTGKSYPSGFEPPKPKPKPDDHGGGGGPDAAVSRAGKQGPGLAGPSLPAGPDGASAPHAAHAAPLRKSAGAVSPAKGVSPGAHDAVLFS